MDREVFDQEAVLALEEAVGDGAGGEVAAADGAFHGGGPAGLGVVTGEVEVLDTAGGRGLLRAEAVDAGAGGEGGALLDDDDAALELGIAGGGEGGADLGFEGGEGLVLGFAGPIAGGADDSVDGLACGVLSEEPLEGAVHQGGVGFLQDRAVEPEVRAEDGDVLDLVELREA